MNQISYSGDDNKDNLYLDLTISNDFGATSRKQISFQENRRKPLLDNPSEYKLNVDKIYINSGSIAIFEFRNNTYFITIRDILNNTYQDVVLPPSGPILPEFPNIRFIYEIQTFLDVINDTFDRIYTLGSFVFNAPFIRFNSETRLLEFYKDINDTNRIWMNAPLAYYFYSLPYNVANLQFNSLSGEDVEFLHPNNYGVNQVTFSGNTWIKTTEDFTRVNINWFDIQRILVTSNTLNVRPYNLSNQNQNGVPIEKNIIASFTPNYFENIRSPVINIDVEKEWSDLLGNTPLTKIDFAVSVQLFDGRIFPVSILPSATCSIRMHFCKREFIVGDGQ